MRKLLEKDFINLNNSNSVTVESIQNLVASHFNLNIQDVLKNIGLGNSITSQRTNGFLSALEKIKKNISNYE